MTATMAPTRTRIYRLGEFHRFHTAGAQFLYLVPAGAIFAVDAAVGQLIDCLTQREASHDRLIEDLIAKGQSRDDAEELVAEMNAAKRCGDKKGVGR